MEAESRARERKSEGTRRHYLTVTSVTGDRLTREIKALMPDTHSLLWFRETRSSEAPPPQGNIFKVTSS